MFHLLSYCRKIMLIVFVRQQRFIWPAGNNHKFFILTEKPLGLPRPKPKLIAVVISYCGGRGRNLYLISANRSGTKFRLTETWGNFYFRIIHDGLLPEKVEFFMR